MLKMSSIVLRTTAVFSTVSGSRQLVSAYSQKKVRVQENQEVYNYTAYISTFIQSNSSSCLASFPDLPASFGMRSEVCRMKLEGLATLCPRSKEYYSSSSCIIEEHKSRTLTFGKVRPHKRSPSRSVTLSKNLLCSCAYVSCSMCTFLGCNQ